VLVKANLTKVRDATPRVLAGASQNLALTKSKEGVKNKMKKLTHKLMKGFVARITLFLIVGLAVPSMVFADVTDAKRLLKAMSDHLAAQKALSFEYDAALEIVTTEDQKIALASSGSVVLNRPDKIRTTRAGGFVDVETFFDGDLLTILGKNENVYAQAAVPGTIDELIDELRTTYDRPLPAGNFLLSKPYDEMMLDVIDIKDIGSGVIGGVECDHLAFRKEQVDWQIWIAQGEDPYPCKYSVTTNDLPRSPQYTIQFRNWKSGTAVAATDFSFKNTTGADEVKLKDLKGTGDLPPNFTMGESK